MRIWAGTDLPLREFLKRVYLRYVDNTVSDTAAALSYYFIFSLFPFLFFLATLTAYLPLGNSIQTLLERLRPVLPAEAMSLITEHVHELVSRPRPNLLTIGILVTLYSASRGVDAVRKGLNLAYEVTESRPFWRTELLAIGMTVAGAVGVLVGVAALVAGGDAGLWLADHVGLAKEYLLAWRWLRWPVMAALIMLVAGVSYYVLPDVKQRFKYITPGSIAGTLIWLLGTWGFSEYAGHFGRYDVTYGSIGGVIVLMTWLFISGFIFSMGGEINAILEHASRAGKAPGARVEGEAPPPASERPSAVPRGAAAHKAAERHDGAPAGH